MSAGKYLLGTAALVGGVYYYDQYVQPILPRQQHQELAYQTQRVENKGSELNNKLTKKIEEGKKFVNEKTESVTKQVKNSDVYQKLQLNTEDYKKHVEDAVDNDKNVFVVAFQKYIDFVNQLGEGKVQTGTTQYSTVSPNVEVKEKSIFGNWFDKSDNKVDQLKNDADKKINEAKDKAESTKSDFFNWNSKKADELDKKANEAINWTNKQIDYASAEWHKHYEQAKGDWNKALDDLSKQWNDSKKQLNGRFDTEKDRAIKGVEDAKSNFEKLSNDLANDASKNQKLKDAQDHFGKSLENLKLFGDDVYNDFAKRFDDLFNRK